MDILLGGDRRNVSGGEARTYSVGSRGTVTPLHSLQEETAEMCRWVNQHLSVAGYSDQLVTDLAQDMSDGITLLRLVHAVSNIPLPRHFPNPMMRVQRMENLSACLKLLKEHNVPLVGVHAEDIMSANIKTVLAVCGALKRHFTSGPSPRQNGASRGLRRSQISFSSLDKEDMAVLSWLGEVVHRDVQDYTMLYDGRVLCELMNEIKYDVIPQEIVTNGSADERLKKVFEVAERSLYIAKCGVDPPNLHTGAENHKLRSFLSHCRAAYLQQQQQQRGAHSKAGHSTHGRPRTTSREEMFESLRTSSGSRVESREDAMIQLRSYDSLKQKKLSATRGSTASERESHSPPPIPSTPPPASFTPPSSSEHLSQPRPSQHGQQQQQQQQRPSRQRAPLPPARDHLSQSRDQLPHSSKRPLSDLYNTGASSYSDLSTTRSDHASLVKPKRALQKHSSSETLQNSTSTSAHPSDSQLGRPASFEIHRSMDTGLAFQSYGAALSSTRGGSGAAPIIRSHSQSAIQEKPPAPPSTATLLNKSLTQSTESFNQPTFGGGMGPRRVPSYTRLDSSAIDEMSAQMMELQDRVAVLTTQLLLERADMYKQIKKALAKERSKRAAVELKLKAVEKRAQLLSSHYDSLFVQLARELAALKSTPHRLPETGAQTTAPGPHDSQTPGGLSKEMEELKRQVAALGSKGHVTADDKASPLHLSAGAAVKLPKGTTKKSLFLRKRANTSLPPTAKPSPSLRSRLSPARARSSSSTEHMTRSATIAVPPSSSSTAAAAAAAPVPYLVGSTTSLKKLKNFFGEEPPHLENLQSFLEGLGYEHLLPVFEAQQISLAELKYMEDGHFERLGVGLGPRVKIQAELKQLQPLEGSDVI